MLTSLRNNLRGFVAVFIIGLVGVAFVVTDIRDVFSPNTGNDLATGRDVHISDAEFRRAFDNALNFVRQQNGNTAITQRDLVDRGLDREILNRMIVEKALSGWGGRLGLYVSEQTLLETIQQQFRDPVTNEFNADAYKADLAQRGMSAPMFEAMLRDDLMRTQMVRLLQASVHAPQSLGRTQALLLAEERTISVARLPTERVPQIAAPNETDLAAWYQNPPAEFVRPEQRSLTLYIADPAAFTEKVSVSQDEIDRQMAFELNRRGTPELRSYVQISFPLTDRAKAEQAATRLRAGEAPAAIRQAIGGEVVTVADRNRDGVGDPQLADAVFSAAAPGAVMVVETGLGVAAVRLTAVTPARTPPRDTVLAEVRQNLVRRAAETEAQRAVDAFEQAIADGEEVPAAAAAAGVKIVPVSWIDARGLNDAGQPAPAVQGMPQKLQEAFSTPDGETTGFAAVGDGRWISAHVDAIRKSAVRPLADVRERAIAVYREQKTREALEALAQAVIQDVAGGKPFAEAARARGFAIDGAARTVTRRSPPDPTLRQAWGAVFNGKAGDVINAGSAPRLTVVHIDRIERPSDALTPQVIDATRMEFQALLPELAFQAGVQTAVAEANTRINSARLDSLVGRRAGTETAP